MGRRLACAFSFGRIALSSLFISASMNFRCSRDNLLILSQNFLPNGLLDPPCPTCASRLHITSGQTGAIVRRRRLQRPEQRIRVSPEKSYTPNGIRPDSSPTFSPTSGRNSHSPEETMRESALLLLPAVLGLSGCELVGDIFEAGVWVGVLLVVGAIAVAVWLLSRARGS